MSKRIDSTLRGNLGSEIDGVLDGIGRGYRAAVVAAAPASGRVCVGGYLLVNGVPLERTAAADDPKTPVHDSRVLDLITLQSKREAVRIPLYDVLRGPEHLSAQILKQTADILVFDAATDADIGVVAQGCVKAGIPFICVDPGAFTLRCAQNLLSAQSAFQRALLVVGSRTELTRRQIEYFARANDALICRVDTSRLLKDCAGETERAVRFLKEGAASRRYLCLLTSGEKAAGRAAGGETRAETAVLVCQRLNGIGRALLDDAALHIGLVYLSGGDIAQGFLRQIGADVFDVIDEVMPLAVYGKVAAGDYSGLSVLTKGGLVGEEDALAHVLPSVYRRCFGGML